MKLGKNCFKPEMKHSEIIKCIYDNAEEMSKVLGVKVKVNYTVVEQVLANYEYYGFPMCPCGEIVGLDSLCPCPSALINLKIHGSCFCGLYYLDVEDEDKLSLKGTKELNDKYKLNIEFKPAKKGNAWL